MAAAFKTLAPTGQMINPQAHLDPDSDPDPGALPRSKPPLSAAAIMVAGASTRRSNPTMPKSEVWELVMYSLVTP